MKYPHAMSELKHRADLTEPFADLQRRKALFRLQQIGERDAIDEFGDDARSVTGTRRRLVKCRRIGMAQPAEQFHFPAEHFGELRLSGKLFRQKTHNDLAVARLLAAEVDSPHPSFTEEANDLIAGQ